MGNLKEIYEKTVSRVSGNADFTGFKVFHFQSETNSGIQSKASIPFLRFGWSQIEGIRQEQRWRVNAFLTITIEVRWETTFARDDPERITEQEKYLDAITAGVYPRQTVTADGGDFLGLPYILQVQMDSEPFVVDGTEEITQNGLILTAKFEYIKGVSN